MIVKHKNIIFKPCKKNVKYLAPEICYLKSSKIIELDKNNLNTLPIDINKLELLEILRLNDNKFVTFPLEICLPNLNSLEIQHNCLIEFPYKNLR